MGRRRKCGSWNGRYGLKQRVNQNTRSPILQNKLWSECFKTLSWSWAYRRHACSRNRCKRKNRKTSRTFARYRKSRRPNSGRYTYPTWRWNSIKIWWKTGSNSRNWSSPRWCCCKHNWSSSCKSCWRNFSRQTGS